MKRVFVIVTALLLAFAALPFQHPGQASAAAPVGANLIVTGHDMDFHCAFGDTDECAYLKIVLNIARNGSSLPVLALDQGTEVPQAIVNAYGASAPVVVTVDPTSPAFATFPLVGPMGQRLYSAIVTASDETCGGCDNNSAGENAIAARSAAIDAAFNAGTGILGLSGADNTATYYKFLPITAIGVPTTSPYTPTALGSSLGITLSMTNCCATHNSFVTPPASSPLKVAETDATGIAETLIALNTSFSGGGLGGGGTPCGTVCSLYVGFSRQYSTGTVSATAGIVKMTGGYYSGGLSFMDTRPGSGAPGGAGGIACTLTVVASCKLTVDSFDCVSSNEAIVTGTATYMGHTVNYTLDVKGSPGTASMFTFTSGTYTYTVTGNFFAAVTCIPAKT